MKKTFQKIKNDARLRLGYSIAFLLLLFSYTLTLYVNRQLRKQATLVEHTNQVINNLETMLSRAKDAETGARGFVLTKDSAFLSPYIGSHKSVDSLYDILRIQTSDNIAHQADLTELKKNFAHRFDLLESGLASFVRNNMTRTDSSVAQRPDAKLTMNSIREIIAGMQQREKLLLGERNHRFDKTLTTLNTIIFISLVMAFVLVVLGFFAHTADNRSRQLAQKKVEDYQDELNTRIDELNNANRELIRMRSQEKFASTGRIARTIAHEVRNPLTNINLATEQLKTEAILSDENSSFLFEMISKNSSRINQLISDLLNATKAADDLTFAKVSVNDLLDETLKEAEDRITLINVKVVKQYSGDICEVAVDKEKIKIAFLNIIINALEAMEDKPGSQLILITKGENDKCKVIIIDNGVGMDGETVIKLFEPYFTSKPTGNGLGLTNTQNIILHHKGDISVESKPGHGTTFTITLDFANN